MSTKYFNWNGDAAAGVAGLKYPEGAPVVVQVLRAPILAVQAWHALTQAQRQVIISRLTTAGWVEGEQSKPD